MFKLYHIQCRILDTWHLQSLFVYLQVSVTTMAQVISGAGELKNKAPKWRFAAVLVVVIVLAATAGALLRWAMLDNTKKPVATHSLPALVNEVQNLRLSGNTQIAKRKITAALADPTVSSDTKYLLYIQEGSIETDAGRWSEALVFYLKAAKIKETYEIAVLLGDTYVQAGNKEQAIIWYKKAIPLIPQAGNPLRADDKKTLEDKIKALGGQV